MVKIFYLMMSLCLSLSLIGCNSDECENDGDCDDGLFCNGDEACINGNCLPAGLRDCSDGLTCTADSCDEELDQCLHIATDLDGDGHFDTDCDGDDCDDGDATVFPGAEELCDGLDNDCNGVVFEDQDGDGHFDELFCPDGDDCDDNEPLAYPGAPEICDGIDNNCSGDTDDEADTDGDSYVDPTCGGDDCDDEDASINPGATEVCNGDDDDCDDELDEIFECIRGELYTCETSCLSIGTIECDSHCEISLDPADCEPPEEVCNGYDDDCDGVIDNDLPCAAGEVTDCTTSCGSIGTGICTNDCEPPAPEDCIVPAEVCNGIDDNCNGLIDEGFFCAAGDSAPCETSCGTEGSGPCTEECGPAAVEECIPPEEICNDFIDNDCDLDIDCTDEDCIGDISCGV